MRPNWVKALSLSLALQQMLCGSEHERERGVRPVESNAIGNFVTQVLERHSRVGGERIQRKPERDHPPEVRARLVVLIPLEKRLNFVYRQNVPTRAK